MQTAATVIVTLVELPFRILIFLFRLPGWAWALLLITAALTTVLRFAWTHLDDDSRTIWRIHLRLRIPGCAGLWQHFRYWSRIAAVIRGSIQRPDLRLRQRLCMRASEYAVRLGRGMFGLPLYHANRSATLALAPPESGKSYHLIDRVGHHSGPVLATSSKPDLARKSARRRLARGPVWNWNPLGTEDMPGVPLHFSPLDGCEDVTTAYRIAGWLTTSAHQSDHSLEFWEDLALGYVAALLHAAQVGKRGALEAARWAAGDHREAEGILKEVLDGEDPKDPREAMLSALRLADTSGAGRESGIAKSIRVTASRAFGWAAVPALLDAATVPDGAEPFTFARFLKEKGTVYLLASSAGEARTVSGLFTCFVSELAFQAGLTGNSTAWTPGTSAGIRLEHRVTSRLGDSKAARSVVQALQTHLGGATRPTGTRKLAPPLLMALDEVASVCPLPALPEMLTDAGGKGVLIEVVAHSIGQLQHTWGKPGADQIVGACGLKLLFGGSWDAEWLESISKVAGHLSDQVRKLTPAVLSQIPDYRALVLANRRKPTYVKFRNIDSWLQRWRERKLVPAPQPQVGVLYPPEEWLEEGKDVR